MTTKKERNQRYKYKQKQLIRKEKDKPCAECGVSYPYYVMHFHHLRDKAFSIGTNAGRCSYDKIKAEIDKCVVVCANCHALLTHDK